ncbi:MAG: M67 family metallopeptidase [Candidatus Acidiferrales bacterium]|jgi:proteasome lid subunit RPN8/RPN11
MAGTIRVCADILTEMLGHARCEPGIECCGLLAGRDGTVTAIFPAKNALASATAYEIAPRELFRFFKQMRVEGLEHLGIYHSHPSSENVPSARDIQQAYYSDQVYFIVSPLADAPKPVRAFSIGDGDVRELEIDVTRTDL